MRTAWLVLLVGCELDVVPPKPAPPPSIARIEADPASQVQLLDVVVREYGSDAPISNAHVLLEQYRPCSGDAQVCPPARRIANTSSDGSMHFALPMPLWQVARITAPGYLTECPSNSDDHQLVSDDTKSPGPERGSYLCRLVPPSALVVRDRAQAIRAARAESEMALWLRDHRNARPVQAELVGMRWQVRFETPTAKPVGDEFSEARLVIVDGLDRSAYVLGRWE